MQKIKKHPGIFIGILFLLLFILFFISINIGSIQITPLQLFKGLFVEYNPDVASIYNIRFPRVIVSMIVGGGLALSGLLLQVVLKNPLADPGIIGISSGASLSSAIVMLIFPQLYFFSPIIAFIGGLATFFLIYALSWKAGLHTTRILLIGVAIDFTIRAISNFITSSSSTISSQASGGQFTFMTWSDVTPLIGYIIPVIVFAMFLYKACDLMGLEDKTLTSLGVHINVYRFVISFIAVLLCSISVSIVGTISFVGLIVPHIARQCIGCKHRVLLPVTVLMGSIMVLLADTIGRVIMAPHEISSAVIMAVIGGPLFIVLLKRGYQHA